MVPVCAYVYKFDYSMQELNDVSESNDRNWITAVNVWTEDHNVHKFTTDHG